MKTSMPRALLALFCLLASLAHAAPNSILHRPYDLDTGHGVLRGSLLLPRSTVPPPVVLLVAGSGPTDRDGNNPFGGNNRYLLRLAEALAERGIASVRYDKRGVARSLAAAPREEDLSVGAYVDDVVAWSERLARDPRFSRLILVGHSEGALIASLAAPRTPAEELIAIAGSGQPIDRVLREQLRGRLPPAQLRQADSVLASLKAGETRSDIPPALSSLLRPSVQPYLISLFREDPARAFGRLRIPTLIVQGRNDIQVGVADAKALQRAKPDSQLVLIDGMNHILRIAPSTGLQQLSAYNDPNLPLARQLVEAVSRFILRGADAEKGR
ncbi:alpha/beta hydrolase [Pseudomonas aeruginosa]|uniref:alpha/beta hydrolase n=1 Tax=Pseudomonas aeruginosa TaxID=287 RepID=UPI00053D33B2|nr:alpha/beta hydrolase [Pseudomonas aeruginosa]MBG5525925.1 alpha/beta hydrolase [Pseudomonas aeruginosa]